MIRDVCAGAGLECQLSPDVVVVSCPDKNFSQIPAAFGVSVYLPSKGDNASYMMVRKGLAWHQDDKSGAGTTNQAPARQIRRRHDKSGAGGAPAKELAKAQELAEKEKLGIWGLEKPPRPPWKFRAEQARKER